MKKGVEEYFGVGIMFDFFDVLGGDELVCWVLFVRFEGLFVGELFCCYSVGGVFEG